MTRYTATMTLAFFLMGSPAFAMGCGGECASCHNLTQQEAAKLLKDVGTVTSVTMAPVRGLYELKMERGGRQAVAYLDYGKKHLMPGPIFNIEQAKAPAPAPQKVTKVKPQQIPLDDSLVMGNPKGTKRLFVFTDPECPFCAKLHGELKKLVAMEPDLAVYIKLLPLKIHPHSYDKARVILGARSLELLDKAFAGVALPKQDAGGRSKELDESIRFAQGIGIDSTPTIIAPDGRVLVGYRDAKSIGEIIKSVQ